MCFLTWEDVLESHQQQIDAYGGSHGVRDLGLLESAIAQPSAGCGGQFLHADVFEMAAAWQRILQMSPGKQPSFWRAPQAPVELTAALYRLGQFIQGET